REGGLAARNRDAERLEDGFGLVLVDVHAGPEVVRMRGGSRWGGRVIGGGPEPRNRAGGLASRLLKTSLSQPRVGATVTRRGAIFSEVENGPDAYATPSHNGGGRSVVDRPPGRLWWRRRRLQRRGSRFRLDDHSAPAATSASTASSAPSASDPADDEFGIHAQCRPWDGPSRGGLGPGLHRSGRHDRGGG